MVDSDPTSATPPIPEARPANKAEAVLAEVNAVLAKHGYRMRPVLQLEPLPAALGSPQVDAGAEDGS